MIHDGEKSTSTKIVHNDTFPNGNEITININVNVKTKRMGRHRTDHGEYAYIMKVTYTVRDDVKYVYGIAKAIGKENGEVQLHTPYIIDDFPTHWEKAKYVDVLHSF